MHDCGQFERATGPRDNPQRQGRTCKLQTEKPLGGSCCANRRAALVTSWTLYPGIVVGMVSLGGRIDIQYIRLLENIRASLCLVNIKSSILKSRQLSPLCAHLRLLLLFSQRYPSMAACLPKECSCPGCIPDSSSLFSLHKAALPSHQAPPSLLPHALWNQHCLASTNKLNANLFSKLSARETIYKAWQSESGKISVSFFNIGATDKACC